MQKVEHIGLIRESPTLVNFGEWDKEITYKFTDYVQPYIFQTRNGKREAYMLVAKESRGDDPFLDNSQGNGRIWRRQQIMDLIVARKITAEDIDVDNLVVRKLKSKEMGPRVEIEGSIMHVYGEGMHPNMVFGVNDAGYAVMEYYTADGVKLYDLGPSGLDVINFAPVKWTEKKLKQFSTTLSRDNLTWMDFQKIRLGNVTQANAPIFYTYYAGGNPTVSPEEREREKYTYASINGPKIADGWYYFPPYANDRDYRIYPSNNSGNLIKPEAGGLYSDSYGIVDRDNIYIVKCYLYVGGILTDSANYYFQENPKNDGGGITIPDR